MKLTAGITESTTPQKKFDGDCHYCRKYGHRKLECLKEKSDISTGKSHASTSVTDSNWVVNLTMSSESRKGSAKSKKMKKTLAADEKRL